MKILHLIQKSQLRGAEVFASQLSTHFIQAGHETLIVYLFQGDSELPFTGRKISLGGNSVRRLWDFSAWRNLARIIREENPDIIQANAGDTLKYAVFSRVLCGWKQPIVFRNASTISLYIKSSLAKAWNRVLFRYVSRVISVSEASKKDFGRLFPEFTDKLVTIPTGIENSPQWQHTETSVRDKAAAPRLVHVGGFSYEKNHKGLLRIFERILKDFPSATLDLVGSGPLMKQTEALASSMGLSKSVCFHGFKTNALQYIRDADALLLPSIIEGMPGVILEAFYCKTPVIAYNVGGIGEVLINNKTGRLIGVGNEAAFASAVIDSLSESKKNMAQVSNAYGLVMSSHLNATIAERFLNVYRSVLIEKEPVKMLRMNNG